jgi:cytochrome bd-type quinol oxidase subunit 2
MSGRFLPVTIVWLAWLVLMAGANLATPLYAVYAERFHFSSLVLTLVFATYAFALVPSLIPSRSARSRSGCSCAPWPAPPPRPAPSGGSERMGGAVW